MKEFEYQIKDAVGIHARPAGLLVKEASKYQSVVNISCNGKTGDAKRIFGVMGLGASKGDTVRLTVEGEDEEACVGALQSFLENHL